MADENRPSNSPVIPEDELERPEAPTVLSESEAVELLIMTNFVPIGVAVTMAPVDEESDTLDLLEEKFENLVKVHEVDPKIESKMQEYLPVICERLVEKLRALWVSNKRWNPATDSLVNILKFYTRNDFEKTKSMLYLLLSLGAHDHNGNVHLNDICGGEGIAIFMASILREQFPDSTTSCSCYERNPLEKKAFELLTGKKRNENFSFRNEDVGVDTVFDKRDDARNIWLIKHPEKATRDIVENIANLTGAEIPDVIGLQGCTCHSYNSDMKPGADDSIVSQKDWDSLSSIFERYMSNNVYNDKTAYDLATRAVKLMDLIRAHYINTQNPLLQAEIHVLPRISGVGIIKIKRK